MLVYIMVSFVWNIKKICIMYIGKNEVRDNNECGNFGSLGMRQVIKIQVDWWYIIVKTYYISIALIEYDNANNR